MAYVCHFKSTFVSCSACPNKNKWTECICLEYMPRENTAKYIVLREKWQKTKVNGYVTDKKKDKTSVWSWGHMQK